MRTVAFVWVLCVVGSMLLSVVAVPTVSALTAEWGTAELVGNGGRDELPDVAIDPSGNATVVWQQRAGGFYKVYANRYVPGTGWGTPRVIGSSITGNARLPQVVVDASGNAIATWEQFNGGLSSVYANRYVPGTGWGTPELLEENDTADASNPRIAISPSGNAVAVWSQHDVLSDVYANRYVPGTGWGTPELLGTGIGLPLYPAAAIDAGGNVLAAWSQFDGIADSLYANRYVPGTGWGTPTIIEADERGPVGPPEIAVDSDGDAVAVWQQFDGVNESVYANRYVPGTGWGTAVHIAGDTGDGFYPDVAVDPSGNAVAVWYQSDGAYYSIYANRYAVGTGWGTPQLIETDDAGDAFSSEVAVDAGGNALAVWSQRGAPNDTFNIVANWYAAGTGWGNPQIIEANDAGDAKYPQVAVSPSGDAMVVWQQYEGTWDDIWANRCEIGMENPVPVTPVLAVIVLVPVLAIVAVLVFLLARRRKRGAGPQQ